MLTRQQHMYLKLFLYVFWALLWEPDYASNCGIDFLPPHIASLMWHTERGRERLVRLKAFLWAGVGVVLRCLLRDADGLQRGAWRGAALLPRDQQGAAAARRSRHCLPSDCALRRLLVVQTLDAIKELIHLHLLHLALG